MSGAVSGSGSPSAAALLAAHGAALEAVAQAPRSAAPSAATTGGAGSPAAAGAAEAVAAALSGAARSLRPSDLCAAYASGLDGKTLDSSRLLALARGALDALNTASRAGGSEATAFLTHALHTCSLFALVFRDEREAHAAVELELCESTLADFEAMCRRVALTMTRPAKPGTIVRTVYTLPDGFPLNSFVLFGEDDEPLLGSFLAAFAAKVVPVSSFSLYAKARLHPGEKSDAAVARAQLGERFIAAASDSYIAFITIATHNTGVGSVPATCAIRMSAACAQVSLTAREIQGLFLTFGKHQIGVAAMSALAVYASSGPAFSCLLDPHVDGFGHVLAALSDPTIDEPTIKGCLILLSFACNHSERFAQALVDKGAFKLLQPVIRHDNTALAVRACFAVASIAVSCDCATEPLRWSGALELIASVLRAVQIESVVISGFLTLIMPTIIKLLQPGVEPALQLAALHRLGAALSGTMANAAAATTTESLLAALRDCASSRDASVAAAAKYVMRELRQPLVPPAPSPLVRKLTGDSSVFFDSASASMPSEKEGATRAMLAEILGRGAVAPATWRGYIKTSISEAQLDALAGIGATDHFGAPLRPVAMPESLHALFPQTCRAALTRFGIIE